MPDMLTRIRRIVILRINFMIEFLLKIQVSDINQKQVTTICSVFNYLV